MWGKDLKIDEIWGLDLSMTGLTASDMVEILSRSFGQTQPCIENCVDCSITNYAVMKPHSTLLTVGKLSIALKSAYSTLIFIASVILSS